MQNEISIRLIPDDDILSILPLLQALNPAISERTLRDRLAEMVSQGYKCAGTFAGDRLVGICGMWIFTKSYVGRHLEPDNVIVLEEFRSMGVGRRLLAFVYEYAQTQGCLASELNCYLENGRAQDFRERKGYRKIAVHYQKSLGS